MILLHSIGERINSNYNTLDEILETNEPLSFDGVYQNVYLHREALIGKDVTLFVMGEYVGKTNEFDNPQKIEPLCTWDELFDMEEMGFQLGWHTWSHRDLTTLTPKEIGEELKCPFPTTLLAYPYGKFNETVISIAKDMGYTHAYSVTDGDGSAYQLTRHYLNH